MKRLIICLMATMMLFPAFAQKQPKRDKAVVKKEKELVGNFVYIPATHFTRQDLNEDGTYGPEKTYTVRGFYILETEVTNKAYNMFLEDLKAQGRTEDYEKARIRTENWLTTQSHNEPMRLYYDSHPAYQDYPAVNVPYEGAVMFCQWLTEKAGNSEWEYTLPSLVQWMGAAQGGHEDAVYSMGGPFLTSIEGKPLYGYRSIGDESITKSDHSYQVVDGISYLNTRYYSNDHPNHVKSFYPNAYGLYNMCGNVAEMVYEQGIALGGSWQDPGYDIRIASTKFYTEPTQQIGFRVIAMKVVKIG